MIPRHSILNVNGFPPRCGPADDLSRAAELVGTFARSEEDRALAARLRRMGEVLLSEWRSEQRKGAR